MKTLLELIRLSEEYLQKQGIDKARREAEWVIADALNMRRIDLYMQHDRPVIEEELIFLRQAIQRRGKGEPAAYISGKVSFAGLTLAVNSSVLIPRPETEILVEEIAKDLSKCSLERRVLWDVCCGSGCIGLALKKRFPELKVVLSDISESSLEVAKKNAAGMDVEFRLGDLFQSFAEQVCDFFICNPPYVSEKEFETLAPGVRDFEPKRALVGGKTGLEFYERIAQNLDTHLAPHGQAWFEIGSNQGALVQKLFPPPIWKCRYSADYAGHDRFFFLERQ